MTSIQHIPNGICEFYAMCGFPLHALESRACISIFRAFYVPLSGIPSGSHSKGTTTTCKRTGDILARHELVRYKHCLVRLYTQVCRGQGFEPTRIRRWSFPICRIFRNPQRMPESAPCLLWRLEVSSISPVKIRNCASDQ